MFDDGTRAAFERENIPKYASASFDTSTFCRRVKRIRLRRGQFSFALDSLTISITSILSVSSVSKLTIGMQQFPCTPPLSSSVRITFLDFYILFCSYIAVVVFLCRFIHPPFLPKLPLATFYV